MKYVCTYTNKDCVKSGFKCEGCFGICGPNCEERELYKDEELCKDCQYAKTVGQHQKEIDEQIAKNKIALEEWRKKPLNTFYDENGAGVIKRKG